MAQKPVAIVCVGMAGELDLVIQSETVTAIVLIREYCLGSGKTTFMQRINSHLHTKRDPPYVINLDPAVRNVPFDCNIDIRESVNYKEVMKDYNLGPNGGILTSLNLFATKIDQLIQILEKRTRPDINPSQAKPINNIIVDTPGQIEVFVWSASGSILLDSLASSFPTVIAYIIDTPRTCSTSTFMSNMLYACSILYKTKLPMILVFNKTDVKDADFAKDWMTDFESFQAALKKEEEIGSFGGTEGGAGGVGGGSGYMGSLLNSMSLMLEEFYRHLSVIGLSSMTGQGVGEFFNAVAEKAQDFETNYRPELEKRQKDRLKEKEARREKELDRSMKDMNVSTSESKPKAGSQKNQSINQKAPIDTISDIDSGDDLDITGPEDEEETQDETDEEEQMEDPVPGHANLTRQYQKALNEDKVQRLGL
ncbi:MAG: hypothetical protein LQ342_001737 [Letrouitia transgressa]|nr:MAG: hypothetical protein LQ342_001737 [Letrouitia transgressa]